MSTEIFNIALDRISEEAILDATDDRAVVKWLNRNYDHMRNALLRSHPWNFAIELASLPALSAAPAFRWTYAYQLPADCLRLLPLTLDGDMNGAKVPYEIVGRKIFTDQSAPLPVRYIRKVTDIGGMDALFIQLLGAMLAERMAHWISGKQSYADRIAKEIQTMRQQVLLIDALEGTPEQPDEADWINGRFTGTI